MPRFAAHVKDVAKPSNFCQNFVVRGSSKVSKVELEDFELGGAEIWWIGMLGPRSWWIERRKKKMLRGEREISGGEEGRVKEKEKGVL